MNLLVYKVSTATSVLILWYDADIHDALINSLLISMIDSFPAEMIALYIPILFLR